MVWGAIIGAGASLVGSFLSKRSGDKANNTAKQIAQQSDPFAPYRAGYATRLQEAEAGLPARIAEYENLRDNPLALMGRPGYIAGMDALTRRMASKGYLGSGNMASSMMNYASDVYNRELLGERAELDWYTQELMRLAGLAGAGQQPGAGMASAAQMQLAGMGQQGYAVGQLANAAQQILPVFTQGNTQAPQYTPPTWNPPNYSLSGGEMPPANYSFGS